MLGFLPVAAAPLADNGIPAPISVSVTGLSATGAVGEVLFLTLAEVTGVSATASVGSVVVDLPASDILVGQAATGGVGSVTVTGTSTLQLVGLQATGNTNAVLVWSPISPPVSDIWIEIVP